MSAKVTQEQIQQILALYAAGEKYKDIDAKVGVYNGATAYYVSSYNLTRRPKGSPKKPKTTELNTDTQRKIAQELDNPATLTYQEIGDKFGVSREAVRLVADKLGWDNSIRRNIRTTIRLTRMALQNMVKVHLNKLGKTYMFKKPKIPSQVIIDMYNENVPINEIEKIGLNRRAIYIRLDKHNIPRKKPRKK